MSGEQDLPIRFLRIEGAVLLALSTFLYWWAEASWLLFLVLLLLPDVGMIGYLRGTRVGAGVYNLFHIYLAPAVLAIFGFVAGVRLPILVALAWFAHIGMDRMLGFGLKHTTGFRDTHLGRIGAAKERRSGEG